MGQQAAAWPKSRSSAVLISLIDQALLLVQCLLYANVLCVSIRLDFGRYAHWLGRTLKTPCTTPTTSLKKKSPINPAPRRHVGGRIGSSHDTTLMDKPNRDDNLLGQHCLEEFMSEEPSFVSPTE